MAKLISVIIAVLFFGTLLFSCKQNLKDPIGEQKLTDSTHTMKDIAKQPVFTSGYADVNGLKMYYEVYGEGRPLVLLHGGGSTIQTSFARIIPGLARNRKVIGVDLQAHGRTSDRGKPSSFEQDADDVVALLKKLHIDKADILGFSNGGQTALKIAIHSPDIVNKLVVVSAFYKRSAVPSQFWEGIKHATIASMPQVYKDEFLKVTPDSAKLRIMFDRDATRMRNFNDWNESEIKSIKLPTLIVSGDRDVMTPQNVLDLHHHISNSELMILPGAHGEFMGEISFPHTEKNAEAFVILIENFLNK